MLPEDAELDRRPPHPATAPVLEFAAYLKKLDPLLPTGRNLSKGAHYGVTGYNALQGAADAFRAEQVASWGTSNISRYTLLGIRFCLIQSNMVSR